MASKHTRRGSGRAQLSRRTTRGPLDEEDPLSLTVSTLKSPLRSNSASPVDTPPIATETASPTSGPSVSSSSKQSVMNLVQEEEKDLSFLLDPSIYHPLSQLETAAPFRHPFPPVPSRGTPLSSSLAQLDSLLARCDFLSAAHLSASILGSGTVQPTDVKTVFYLIGLRYSCLELTGNLLLAAQEAKALEDLTSTFYYYEPTLAPDSAKNVDSSSRAPPQHMIPFPLRLQALRLQSIGFSDPRRGVSALYEIALECREQIASPHAPIEDKKVWRERLDEVGIRVVNALVEMGDVDCATRMLESMRPIASSDQSLWTTRTILLFIKVGKLIKARELLDGLNQESENFEPLLALAEGRYEDAAKLWGRQKDSENNASLAVVRNQNLAVAYLYSGQFQKAKALLEELVDAGDSFQSLTMNLATMFELSSDKSKDLKMAMAANIAKQQQAAGTAWSRTNVDFKL